MSRARSEDSRARSLAQREFVRPLVLEAGAGTGKTATLIARVVAWTTGAGWELAAEELDAGAPDDRVAARTLEGVLAITFTEAAAAEMAERVGEALAALEGVGDWPVGLEADAVPPDEEVRRTRARALLGQLDRLVVRTIHAWCLRLLAAHPVEAGLPPVFEVDADESRTHELAGQVVAGALRDPARATELLDLLAIGHTAEDVREALLALAREGVDVDAFDVDPVTDDRLAPIRSRAAELLASVQDLGCARLADAPGGASVTRAAGQALLDLGRVLVDEAPLPTVVAAAGGALEQAKRLGEWGKGTFNRTESKILDARTSPFSAALGELLPLLQELAVAERETHDRVRATLGPLHAELHSRRRERGLVGFTDLLRLARDLLERQPDVAALEASRLRQLLVDEFQDTSVLQCELVGRIALSGPAPQRPGLFLVGDPKQSIYGWRNADLRGYADFVDAVLRQGGERLSLTVNFRSPPVLLDEVSRVVDPVMKAERGVQPPFEKLLPCEALAGDPGFAAGGRAPVEYWSSQREEHLRGDVRRTTRAASTELEARCIAADVAGLHEEQGVAWSDVALLLRSATDQDVYLSALRAAGIPYAVAKDRSYYQRREVIEAAALVRTVFDPNDHLALLTLLRCPLVGVPDAALIPLWAGELPRLVTNLRSPTDDGLGRLRDLAAEVAGRLPSDVGGFDRIAGWEDSLGWALGVVARVRAMVTDAPSDEIVALLREGLAADVTAATRWLGAWRVANLDRFFRELTERLADPDLTLDDVLRRLRRGVSDGAAEEDGRPREAAGDAVQVMTIHGSKGLDFAHVYLPGLDRTPPPGESKGPSVVRFAGGWEYQLLGARTPGHVRARRERFIGERAERVRLLYVAMTRARRRLVVCAQLPRTGKTADAARSMAELLPSRHGGWPVASVLEAARPSTTDADGVRWDLLGLAERPAVARVAETSRRSAATPADVLRQADALAGHRAAAAARSARAWSAPASHATLGSLVTSDAEPADARFEAAAQRLGPDEARQRAAQQAVEGELELTVRRPRPESEPTRGEARLARLVGSVVHRALENLDLRADADVEGSWREQVSRLGAHAELLAEPGDVAEVAGAAGGVLQRVREGAAWSRLLRLRGCVLARELPVLLPPPAGADGPVAFGSGAIDLVHRDPETGEIVIADWKTDRIESEGEVERHRRAHAAQGAAYVKALQAGLGLERPPPFDLWFLWPGRVERLRFDGRPEESPR